ncbi:MAG: nuclear transport factor 2 family protein [Candidatus Acidiferrum sp.]
MKFVLALLLLATALPARAQTPEELEELTPQQRVAKLEMAHDELATLEKENARALQQRNLTFFRRVYSDDFIAVAPNGRVMDKNQFLSALQLASDFYSSFVVSDIRVRIYKEVAVVTSTRSTIALHEGHTVGQQFRVTRVYVYGQHGWQAVSSQETLLPG